MIKLLFTCCTLLLLLGPGAVSDSEPDNYLELWKEVYGYELDGLPKSANAVVEKIYVQAKKDNNEEQLIKALIYQSKFSLELEENAQLKIFSRFKREINTAQGVSKNVLESLLANMLHQYFNGNRWRIYRRTETTDKVDSIDFRTWDLHTLLKEISTHYENSLRNSSLLEKTSIDKFKELIKESPQSYQYSPTLYDFLAHQAIEFYTTGESTITSPAYKFYIDDSAYLDIALVKLESPDSLSLEFQALQTYQHLVNFHKADENPAAYIMIRLEALEFINRLGIYNNKNRLLHNELKKFWQDYQQYESSTLIAYKRASLFVDSDKPLALQIAESAIEEYPNSYGTEQCKALVSQIKRKEMRLEAEKYVPISSHSLMKIEYKNLDSLHFKIYRVSPDQYKTFYSLYTDSAQLANIKKWTDIKEWGVRLKNFGDYELHSTEILLPKLPNGRYVIFSSDQPFVDNNQLYSYQVIQFTDMALVQNRDNREYNYHIIDRTNGEPIKNAEVILKNNGRTSFFYNKSFTTNSQGVFKCNGPSNYNNYDAIITTKGDTAYFDNYYMSKIRSGKNTRESVDVKAFLFTDRSIYRPGQTVYFKGILVKRQGNRSSIVPAEYVGVTLEDVNGEEVGMVELRSNEYGSFSGEFILPRSGLTGQYTLHVDESYEHDSQLYDEIMNDFEWSAQSISVEEYKRPRFEVEFDAVKQSYRVNDTIKVFGEAAAFAGSKVTEAKVSYTITRKVEYPRWYYWSYDYYYPSTSGQEITHGETTTDGAGKYVIDFKALPDETVDKESLPIFIYEVNAEVTDVNGETRSATTTVQVGYHTMVAHMDIPDQLNRNDIPKEFTVSTENLNSQFTPAKGSIEIYRMVEDNRITRPRPWSVPDHQRFSEEEFHRLFPHEKYYDDTLEEGKKELVTTLNFNTSESKIVSWPNIKDWRLSNYEMVLNTKDSFDNEVIDKRRFKLIDPDRKVPGTNDLFTISTDKSTYQPGEEVKLSLASAADEVFVTLLIEKDYQIVEQKVIRLKNEVKTINIPIEEKDLGGFAILYHYACYNSFDANSLIIPVTKSIPKLEIETSVFRDKLQPGAEETWKFKVLGENNEKLSAELLASMYDASLDQFKPHEWRFSPYHTKTYYTYSNSSARQSFGSEGAVIRNRRSLYPSPYTIQKDDFYWFGFSFNNNRYANSQYLSLLKRIRKFETKESVTEAVFDNNIRVRYVEGLVTNSAGDPLPGVNIIVKGTNRGAVTDIDGHYSIKASKTDLLVFRFIGFTSTEVSVKDKNRINAILGEDVSQLSEVVVVGYGMENKRSRLGFAVSAVSNADGMVEVADEEAIEEEIIFEEAPREDIAASLQGKVAGVQIRGASSIMNENSEALYVLDGKVVSKDEINPKDLASAKMLKGDEATALYGSRAANGVIIFTSKAALEEELSQVQARTNLKETAFFFPQLRTDENGEISFEFTAPEALTRWKLQLLAHDKDLHIGQKTLQAVTQKELMVTPNAPRFLRESDEIIIAAKISSLSDEALQGFAALQLYDATTGESIDQKLELEDKTKNFEIEPKGNTSVSWRLSIPAGLQAVEYKVVAKAGNFSDGEQSVLPVLTNRMLVTETMSMDVHSGESKTFTLDKLKKNTSKTLTHHKLTLEITSNPAWYAVQALPYLMEYPYECAEQTFSRFYANSLGSHIVNANPKIAKVFDQWKEADALVSALEKNEELKSLIISETPWLRDAENETEQKKRIALLFDLNHMQDQQTAVVNKLKQMQFENGGFPWFAGSDRANRYITQHIITGIAHLQKLGVEVDDLDEVVKKAMPYLESELIDDYKELIKYSKMSKDAKKYMAEKHITPIHIQYLYLRSFYPDQKVSSQLQPALDYYTGQAKEFWKDERLMQQGMIALIHHKSGEDKLANGILKSLDECSITSEEMGMYWKANESSYFWYQAPIETQALMIEVFTELGGENQQRNVDNLKLWLLKHKQTNQWTSTKATTEAVYALLLKGSSWLDVNETLEVKLGKQAVDLKNDDGSMPEAGTGYIKKAYDGAEITPAMAEVTLTKKDKGVAWGALYWQYFENLDKITSASSPLSLTKKVFKVVNTDTGEKLEDLSANGLQVGDRIRVRIELKVDREMDFVHMKDMRASGLEPINVLSSFKYQDGLGYYESTRDASTNFFFEHLTEGVFVFEYDLRANNAGDFSNGITSIQCMYAPEFSNHSEGIRLEIEQ
ncbi:alpha-2-macroglobulin family protein [Fulvivirga sediminis]|uniref:Carboxypeptidase-like regulatory domain-containing protein n=1 Tax=Fulvivirga sediminis TaxID=2803949 RepID=A0A937FB07_9BACT|nr:MG2 domain-containing protein [Fulvivirga sediminis]MBL3657869.1 carboxypeptidase-like regulatory domain-containing protein [Fulvivirga sediminis]